jgi:AcrR family transcriptional regulator
LRERAREAASAAILDAAEAVAIKRGIEATSIAAIAEHAGVAVGTLYNYFPDRTALLSMLFQVRREQMIPQLAAAATAARDLPFERRLRAYMTDTLGVFDKARPFCQLAMSSDPHTIIVKGRPTLLPVIVSALTEILKPVTGAASVAYANMIVGAMKQLLSVRLERGEPLAPAAPLIVDTFLRGITRRR